MKTPINNDEFNTRSVRGFLRLLFISCFLLSFSTAVAQYTLPDYAPLKVIPPSPTASSLGVYGSYDVGHYSGRPDITVPIYQIQTNNHSLPIRLQYDATGIRASQQASWVGLSWSLSAGGLITRTVRGLDDFGNNGYYLTPPFPPGLTIEAKAYFDQVAAGTMDTEADIFSYNVGPYSGKFVMSKQVDGGNIYVDQQNSLKIEYHQNSRWTLTDGQGYKYYFATQEFTRDLYDYAGPTEINDHASLDVYTRSIAPSITSSWYLDSIVSPTQEGIRFYYESTSASVSFIQKSEKASNLLEIFGSSCPSVTPRLPAGNKTYYASKQVIADRYLKAITFSGGSIIFKRTDRDDLEYIEDNKPDKLSEMIIYDSEENLVKHYTFHYSYFNDGELGRLKLDSLTERDKYGNNKPPYRFGYHGTSLVNPYTKGIDHWGYPNGQTGNTTLIPSLSLFVTSQAPKYFSGAVRNPSTSDAILKQGVISSIQYPTGGTTHFDYELHTYGNLRGNDAFTINVNNRNTIANPNNQTNFATDTFTLKSATLVDFSYNYTQADITAIDYFSIEVFYAYVLREDGSTYTAFSNHDCPIGDDPTCGSSEGESSLVLPAGSYKIRVWYQPGWETTLRASWKTYLPSTETQLKGGGLRIKSITNQENGKPANIKKYIYTTNLQTPGATTGKIIFHPIYEYMLYAEDAPLWDCPPFYGHYVLRVSSAINPTGLASGGPIIGYNIVTEINGKNGEGGKVEYTFLNDEAPLPNLPFAVSNRLPYNGKLKQKVTLNAEGEQISKVEYDYAIKNEYALESIKLQQERFPEIPNNYCQIARYYDYSHWVVKRFEKETVYTDEGPIINETHFDYANRDHKEITRIESQGSNKARKVIKLKYPGDYSQADPNSFVGQMKSRNIISTVVEEQVLIEENSALKLASGTFTSNRLFHNRFFKPDSIYRLTNTTPLNDTTESNISGVSNVSFHPKYKLELVIDEYNENGTVKQFHKADGTYQSYIWDYQETLPVGHITNSSLDHIAYTSFESDGSGGWEFDSQPLMASFPSSAPTGRRFLNLTNTSSLRKPNLKNGKTYIISYWSKNGQYQISGGSDYVPEKIGSSVNGWTFYEHCIQALGTTLTIEGNGAIDEVRLYPTEAQINTYTYDQLTGKTSSTDANGVTTYFEYDGFQRLRAVKDQQGNLLQWNYYHYAK